jgi:hypothetical protein
MTSVGDNRCPLCRAALWAPDAEAIGGKRCPRCGADLWVLIGSAGPRFFLRQPGQSKINFLAALAGPLHGKSTDQMEGMLMQADSLDLVEIVVEIEKAIRSGLIK